MQDCQIGGNEFMNAKQKDNLDVFLFPDFRQMPNDKASQSMLLLIFMKNQGDAF
jgi:hypothetical protein